MDSIWARKKKLEGTTLYIATQRSPFEIIKVDKNKLVFPTSGEGEFRVK